MLIILNLIFGMIFGFILSRVGATDYSKIINMFLLKDLHLMFVIGSAIIVGIIGMQILKRTRLKTITGKEIVMKPKDRHWGNIIGGLIFGVGWAITGSCPGTIITQIGEGKLAALLSFLGIMVGTYLFGVLYPKLQSCQVSLDKKE